MRFCASSSRIAGEDRFSGFTRLAAGVLALLLILLATPVQAQEEEDLTTDLGELQNRLKQGKEYFNQLKFQDAVVELTRVVEIYEQGKIQDLGDREILMVAEALELRARAYFNQGETGLARQDFVRLLQVKVDYQIDKNLVSKKVVDLFDEVRKETLGTLSVTTDPPGAEARLNDEPLTRTPIVGRPAIKGTYRLKLSHPGFEDYEEAVTINPRTEVKREIRLIPNRRSLQFITQPVGVNVYLDGVLSGTTFGTLPAELNSLVREAGLDPAQASAPLLIKNVPQGEHEVRFERDCFELNPRKINVTLDVERNLPQTFQPVLMKQNMGQLKITSHPSGADVLVNGVVQGTTPLQLPAVCAGEQEIRLVKKGGGTWFDRVRIKSGAVNVLDATLRPTLLYVGTFRLDEWVRLNWSDEDKLLREGLPGLRSVNQVRADEKLTAFREALLTEMRKPDGADKLRRGAGLPSDRVLDAIAQFQADLVMAVISLQDQPGRGAPTVFLYSAEQPEPDAVRLDLASAEAVNAFLTRFDQVPVLARPWIGATFADSLLGEGPVVVRLIKGGPAAAAGLQSADQVATLNGRKITSGRDIISASAEWKEREKVTFSVLRGGAGRSVAVTLGRSPVLIPLNSPERIYNKALCDYRQISRGADDPLDRALALLNLGISFMHFGSYDKALSEALNVASLPAGGGISRGTVRYYQGLCYLKKDLVPEARTAFQDAASSGDATLESNDGAPVASRARKLLQ